MSGDHRQWQSGSVLALVLVSLVLLGFLLASMMQILQLEQRVSGNRQEHLQAMQAASAALDRAAHWLHDQAGHPLVSADGSAGVWSPVALSGETNPVWQFDRSRSLQWWREHGRPLAYHDEVAEPLRFIIEWLGDSPMQDADEYASIYRLTARGSGLHERSTVYLQTQISIAP